MKKKKGYTIIELLLVISIILVISSVAIVSFITIRNKQKEKDYLNIVENVKTASELYFMNNDDLKERLNRMKIINLPIKNLIEEGYLDEVNTINPVKNEPIKDYCLTISLGSSNEYEFGDLKKCGSFLAMYPNPLILYKGNPVNFYEGVAAYDINGLSVDVSNVTVETDAETKLNNNINQEVDIKYFYDGEEYIRKIKLMLLETVIDEDQIYIIEASGNYEITAYGAQGSGSGGKGGEIVGTVALEKGNTLNVAVGKLGGGGTGQYAGGGATTIKLNNNELIIGSAGGGGGVTGTAGGTGTGAGGICGTNYDTNTCTSGTNGDKFGTSTSISGGGSSGNYKSCTKFKTEWNPCVSGSNTCVAGYITDYSVCTGYYSCSSCGCASYGTKYSSCATGSNTCVGGYVQGSCSSWNYSYSGTCSCWGVRGDTGTRSCNASAYSSGCSSYCIGWKNSTGGMGTCSRSKTTCNSYNQVWDDCKTGSNTCQGGYVIDTNVCNGYYSCSSCGCATYGTKYSSCATGSNTCVGGDVITSECQTLGTSEYKSGNGGSNYYSSKIKNPVSKNGTRSENGQVKIKFIGE